MKMEVTKYEKETILAIRAKMQKTLKLLQLTSKFKTWLLENNEVASRLNFSEFTSKCTGLNTDVQYQAVMKIMDPRATLTKFKPKGE